MDSHLFVSALNEVVFLFFDKGTVKEIVLLSGGRLLNFFHQWSF